MDDKVVTHTQRFLTTEELNTLRDNGLLVEANRQFFHVLGLALTFTYDDDGNLSSIGIMKSSDPNGFYFPTDNSDFSKEVMGKSERGRRLYHEALGNRVKALGFGVQALTRFSSWDEPCRRVLLGALDYFTPWPSTDFFDVRVKEAILRMRDELVSQEEGTEIARRRDDAEGYGFLFEGVPSGAKKPDMSVLTYNEVLLIKSLMAEIEDFSNLGNGVRDAIATICDGIRDHKASSAPIDLITELEFV